MKKAIVKKRAYYAWLLILSALYYLMPYLSRWLAKAYVFQEYLHLDAGRLAVGWRKAMLWPPSRWLSYPWQKGLAWLWFALLLLLLFWIGRKLRPWRWQLAGSAVFLLFLLYAFPNSLLWFENELPSQSIGHVANGKVIHAKRIPFRGDNYTTYSFPGYLAGRTYVNGRVRDLVLEAYEICKTTCPEVTFVLGETGLKHGDTFLPHRTHKNGLSVDFMSPLIKRGKPHRSHHIFNLWGYRLEVNDKGQKGRINLDYESIAQHLLALKQAATKRGMVIQKVIFDPVLRKQLSRTSCWSQIKDLPYTKNRVAWRHDDHYHVDFGFPSDGRG